MLRFTDTRSRRSEKRETRRAWLRRGMCVCLRRDIGRDQHFEGARKRLAVGDSAKQHGAVFPCCRSGDTGAGVDVRLRCGSLR